MNQIHYEPEMWTLKKDVIYAAQEALKIGIENTEELLARHDAELGREHRHNRMTAMAMAEEIAEMKRALENLKP